VALYESYHQLLKDLSPEDAIKTLQGIEDDGASDLYKRAQDILQLTREKSGNPTRKIGVLLPLSGELAPFGQEVLQSIQIAGQLAVSEGVEFLVEDVGQGPDQLLKAWQKLVVGEKVSALLGPLTAKETEMVFERSEVAAVPVISLAPKEGLETFGQFGFRSTLTVEDQVKKVADFIQTDLKAKKIGVLFPDSAYGYDVMDRATKEFKARDLDITEMQVYPHNATDFKEQLRRMARLDFPKLRKDEICPKKGPGFEGCAKKPTDLRPLIDFEVLFVPDSAETVGLLLPTLPYLRMYGVQVVGLSGFNSKRLLERGGEAAEGVIFADGYLSTAKDFPTRFFREQYQRMAKKEPTRLSAEVFDLAMIVIDIMKSSPGMVSREDFKQRLKSIRDFAGVTGLITYENQRLKKDPKLIVVRDGGFQELRTHD